MAWMNNSKSRANSCRPAAHKSIYLIFLLNFYEYFLVYVEHLRNRSPLRDRENSLHNNARNSDRNFSSNVQRAIAMFNDRKRRIEVRSQMYNRQLTHYNREGLVENELNRYAFAPNRYFILNIFFF